MEAIADLKTYDPRQYIIIKGARVHNLKNVDVVLRRNSLVVITGLSGSGKSSLAFDTLYSEGQRRYVESLSAYARQFLGRMHKPEVDYIKGISPAIAIEQKVNTRNPRSTVGTSTEIYEYLKLLFARIGKTYSPVSGNLVMRHSVSDVVDHILRLTDGTMVMTLAPITLKPGRNLEQQLSVLLQQGFSRVMVNDEIHRIEEIYPHIHQIAVRKRPCVIVDRFEVNHSDGDLKARIADSVQTAFYEGGGECMLEYELDGEKRQVHFSSRFELDGITFEEPSVNLFAFNNPYGACKLCEGFGSVIGIDPDLVIPNKSLSIFEGAIVCWKGEKMSLWNEELIKNAYKFDFPIHKPYYRLSDEQKELLWTGNKHFHGLNDFFKMVEENTYKIQYRVMLSRYRGKTGCPECQGTRLRKDAGYVKVAGKSISELVLMPIERLAHFFRTITLDPYERDLSRRLLVEINQRLSFLNDVGLGYLTLNRLSNTLSGGESQRINLATSLGSSLVGSMYILDEPSIGLHQRDTHRLIGVLKKLRDLGNTVIVVEHDEDIMRASDQIVDIGPMAGTQGGEIVFQGPFRKLIDQKDSLTALYLNGILEIPLPEKRRRWKEFVELKGARQHNLKGFDVKFPLKVMTVVTGVSGSGKTSLVKSILYPALKKMHGGYGERTGRFDALDGDYKGITDVEYIDQNPIGKSSRSNPVTYLKAYDDIRNLFADQPLAKTRGFTPGFFSFNIEGGRCPECEGDGQVKIEMQFMADITLVCESCKGKRFREEILDVAFEGKTISDILEMTVDDAIEFFGNAKKQCTACKRIASRIQPLADVGLGYVRLGQPSSTLSGGEAQRIKLASFLTKGFNSGKTLFIFDEPTTGLHFHDISKLLIAFNALIENGHSLVVIEHNPEVIKSADWIIDLGPEGGDEGGHLVFEGTPEDLVNCENSYTGKFLKGKV
ncbi:MAG: excinuclease ABC subunit UvrA [Bacteroidales bacterium]|jgi:excinuclease ABC subunit A|nr:excinuclease ABC subunit UvrA [Bacteroidales bacterium]NLM93781.1 excinuclease ABC subunit UvrA [Bacteroidales bacterium]